MWHAPKSFELRDASARQYENTKDRADTAANSLEGACKLPCSDGKSLFRIYRKIRFRVE